MGQPFPILAMNGDTVDSDLFHAAFRASPEGMAVAERGLIRYANQAFALLVGHVSPSTLTGKPLARFRPARHSCEFSQTTGDESQSRSRLCQFVSKRRDGTPLNIESTCVPFRLGDRDLQLITIRDVTVRERRRMVRDGHERFRVIFEAAHMGILQCDLEGLVLESNPAVERMLGYRREELRGMNFRAIAHSETSNGEDHLFSELAQGRRESYEIEARYVGKSPATGWIRLTVSLVRGVDGRPQFAIGMTEDITERKQADARLREAQKMEVVGRLVSGVAHDFNNLLTGIMLYCDLLIAGLDRNSRLVRHAEEIRIAGEQGRALIQQLLAAARKQSIEPKVLSLNEIVLQTQNLLWRLMGEKYELAATLENDLGMVMIDPAQVQQILFNLALNARDAMPEGGRIEVKTGHQTLTSAAQGGGKEGVFLCVKDSGSGMSAETRAHLFEPFFTTKVNGRGTGLGLSTVHGIVTNNGGIVDVDSELGRGTQVTVILPRVDDTRAVEPGRFSLKATAETVLLLEDNVAIRQAAQRILSECGYMVLEAASGPEAISIARNHGGEIDLLLTDVDTPGMSGHQTAQQICSQRPGLKVLYMSGHEGHAEKSRGDTVFFKKPFTSSALLEKLREILDSPALPKKSAKRKRETHDHC
jgi:two-component system cell cycle sensor histidine kinase/response regulator CckA